MNEMRLNKARLNVVSLNKALINGAVERHGSSAGGGGAPSKYIRFADPAVEAVLMANGVSSDGVGITKEDAAAVTSIGTWFYNNTAITNFEEFKYFTGVTSLEYRAFQGCTSLQVIALPAECTTLADGSVNYGSFRDCSSLRKVVADGLTSLGYGAFQNCSALSDLRITWANVTKINTQALRGCTALSFDFLNLLSLETLGANALNGVKVKKLNLGKVMVLPGAASTSQNYGDKSVLEEVIIPSGVTKIPDASFQNYSKLNKVTANWGGITSFGGSAFYGTLIDGDLELTNANELGQKAFRATKITSIKAPAITKIFDYCFYDCSKLHTIDLGSELTNIYQAALQNCAALETLIVRAITPPSLGTSLSGSPIASGTGVIYVPDAALEPYKTATNWNTYADRIHPLSEIEGSLVFYDKLIGDGVACINTEYYPTSYDNVEWDADAPSVYNRYIFGCKSSVFVLANLVYSATQTYYSFKPSGATLINEDNTKRQRRTLRIVDLGGGSYRREVADLDSGVVNIIVAEWTGKDIVATSALRVFGNITSAGATEKLYNGAIRSFKVADARTNEIRMSLRPCTYYGEAGMWDEVSGKFYGSESTNGAFTAEND